MYRIIGADQREYGPVSGDELRRWIREGRANAQTRIRMEGGTEWRPLGSLPEFVTALPATTFATTPAFEPQTRTSGMAIAGFVLSLFSIPCCTTLFIPLLGFIFSIIGLVQTHRDPWMRGKGLAVAGLILSLILLLLSLFFWCLIGFSASQNPGSQGYRL